MAVSAVVAAIAVLVWPQCPGRARARRLWPRATRQRHWPNLVRPGALAAAAAGSGWIIGGPGGSAALTLVAVTVRRQWLARVLGRRRVAGAAGLADALGLLVAQLRAGAHPAVAAERVATDAEPGAARVLATVATTARLGGTVATALRASEQSTPTLAGPLARLARAWEVAERYGVPLADLLAAAARDIDQRVRFAEQVRARMAGPRTTAAVLAALPVLAVLLGEAMGAGPWHVLTATVPGQFLLVIGALLGCAGLVWSARLTDRAGHP